MMYQQKLEEFLAQAERHIAEGVKQIEKQREILADLLVDGHAKAAKKAAELLDLFQQTQAIRIADRDRIREELAKISN